MRQEDGQTHDVNSLEPPVVCLGIVALFVPGLQLTPVATTEVLHQTALLATGPRVWRATYADNDNTETR